MIFRFIYGILFFTTLSSFCQVQSYSITSPDKRIVVSCYVDNPSYTIKYDGKEIMNNSKLGIVREDEDFSKNLIFIKASSPETIKDDYTMVNAKKKNISYHATQRIIETKTISGKRMNIIFRVSNDGVAFQYEFPEATTDVKKITFESTSFAFLEGTRAWLQPKAEAQTGFEHTNPSYEAHYMHDIATGTSSPGPNGWVYPALFNFKDTWMMITEAALGRTYCGTALQQHSPNNEYRINFPQAPEVFKDGIPTLNPESTLPWKTPWRIIAIGSLKTITESTLGTDLALPEKKMDKSFINPGKASWSWIIKKDDSTVYGVQKRYIDFAADMNWQYCLLDATWDKLIGYDSVKILADYAKDKNVGLLLWYNSAGSWNTVTFTPKDKLLSKETRRLEFARLKEMGIKGLKIDFFAGDGQSMISYYEDLLEDAADFQLLLNFHGSTLPRGLQRTYPNFMTSEAVFGYEMITFGQESANRAAEHSVTSAMVRNNFDPMDFTPMNLYKIPRIQRATTASYELATSVVFLSGIQHYAETPEGMTQVPEAIKNFLRRLPNHWDDVKFIDGYPGKHFIVARKSGTSWYVAGINGEDLEKTLTLDLSFLKEKNGEWFASDGVKNEPSFIIKQVTIPSTGRLEINLKGNDGFVVVFEYL